ncbi:MAG: ABC transporter permease [Peptostreptococcaceae bacterium]|nr:ABC transporter permease [Peptostreptococcaceae bacterium]
MRRKPQNITDSFYPIAFIAALVAIWGLVSHLEIVPKFMLPAPSNVLSALISEAPLLWEHSKTTLAEAFIGLALSIFFALLLAIVMEEFVKVRKTLYPVLIITQTIPTIAIAPLLVLWLGYGMLPKIALIFITCFFPLVISILSGFAGVDEDAVRLFTSMGASRWQMLLWVKLPSAVESFFAGLKVSASYSIVGAVIAEWLGGNDGLGVYMTRVRKSFSFDKMFAVIIVITVISLLLLYLVDLIQKKSMKWKTTER